MMVSHIDDDHIAGMLELMRKLRQAQEEAKPRPWKIKRFWHNSFDDILGNADAALAATGSSFGAASLGGILPRRRLGCSWPASARAASCATCSAP